MTESGVYFDRYHKARPSSTLRGILRTRCSLGWYNKLQAFLCSFYSTCTRLQYYCTLVTVIYARSQLAPISAGDDWS